LDADREHIVFMLWGRIAQRKERLIHVDDKEAQGVEGDTPFSLGSPP